MARWASDSGCSGLPCGMCRCRCALRWSAFLEPGMAESLVRAVRFLGLLVMVGFFRGFLGLPTPSGPLYFSGRPHPFAFIATQAAASTRPGAASLVVGEGGHSGELVSRWWLAALGGLGREDQLHDGMMVPLLRVSW